MVGNRVASPLQIRLDIFFLGYSLWLLSFASTSKKIDTII
jgi:hypothetical protein